LIATLDLRGRSTILVGDIGHRELDIPERRTLVGVAHEPLQDGQAHAGARHVGAERVPEPVRIGARNSVVTTTMV